MDLGVGYRGVFVGRAAAVWWAWGDLVGGIFASSALGVSATGLVVVGESESTSGTQAFRWTSGGGIVGLGDLPGGGKRLNAS